MRNLLSILFFCLLSPTLSGQKQPNVLLILTDDQGSVDLQAYGAQDLFTPNMDRIAQQGVRFTQFYAGAPVCSPSRAALLTGRNHHECGNGFLMGAPFVRLWMPVLLRSSTTVATSWAPRSRS